MKLQLKHLAPYLPYGLKIHRFDIIVNPITSEAVHGYNIETMEMLAENDVVTNEDEYSFHSLIKPILRTLSDLTEDQKNELKQLVAGGKFYVSHVVNMLIRTDLPLSHIIGKTPFVIIQKLLEWHFDIFGLIEAGLAIDINTI